MKTRHSSDPRRAFGVATSLKESTAYDCIVNCVIALAYGVIAGAWRAAQAELLKTVYEYNSLLTA
jgi:hypothetical protein